MGRKVAMYFSLKKKCLLSRMKFFISKQRLLSLTICMLLLVLLGLEQSSNWQPDSARLITSDEYCVDIIPSEPLVYKCCTQMNSSIRNSVYFLKTHKTGGTTIQSVVTRFALMNLLDIMKVNYKSYYQPFSDSSIHSNFKTPNGKYHIMASHMRYDFKLKTYQYPDASMVTILRNPVTLFQSIYTFFRMDRTTGMNFQQFLNASKKPNYLGGFNIEIAYRGYNQMSMDLGFNLRQRKNATAINEFISKIDREFDFVMIMEHMEESLVLLANLMGWPLEYVAFLKLNARLPSSDPYSLTLGDEITILELNEVDALLYDHFLKKFRKCVQQYGKYKLNEQVQQLKMINKRFYNRCVAEEVIGLNLGDLERVEYVPRNKSDLECIYSMQVSPALSHLVKNIQAKKKLERKKRNNE